MSGTRARFWEKVDKSGACWLWTGAKRAGGYGNTWFRGVNVAAHRVSWELALGKIPDGLMVLHHCDVAACVKVEHLYLGVHSDNMRDAVERKRMRSGADHGLNVHPESVQRGDDHWSHREPSAVRRGISITHAKLNDASVKEIRGQLAAGATHRAIAERYGVCRYTIDNVANGRSWKHVVSV